MFSFVLPDLIITLKGSMQEICNKLDTLNPFKSTEHIVIKKIIRKLYHSQFYHSYIGLPNFKKKLRYGSTSMTFK